MINLIMIINHLRTSQESFPRILQIQYQLGIILHGYSKTEKQSNGLRLRGMNISDETHDVSEVKQLCLFVETPSDKDQKPAGSQLEEKGLSSSTYDDLSSASDIDLVLRLGPEPDQDPSTATATKKFF
jgi:hypothetical protein